MPYRFSYSMNNYSDGYWGERPPRNLSRTDAPVLNLFDAGHGDVHAVKNCILFGLGMTVVLDLNSHVKRFSVALEYRINGLVELSKDITDLFERITGSRYEMKAVAGDSGTLGFDEFVGYDYRNSLTFTIVIEVTNITRTARQEYDIHIGHALTPDDVKLPAELAAIRNVLSCATEKTGDFEMFEQFQRAHVRIWRHIGSLNYDPTGSQTMTFWFDESELLIGVEGGVLCPFYNYFTDYHNGIVLSRDTGDGDFVIEDLEAGFNPWDGVNICPDTLEVIDEGC